MGISVKCEHGYSEKDFLTSDVLLPDFVTDVEGKVCRQRLVAGDVEDDRVVVEAAAGEHHVVGRPGHDQRHLVEK